MTISELIEKWGENYIIETKIKDIDYRYASGYLERVKLEENEFIEDLKVVLQEYYLGSAIINVGSNVKKTLPFIGSYYFNWNLVFDLVNSNSSTASTIPIRNMNSYLIDAGTELRSSLIWKLPVKKINNGSFKGEFVEESLSAGSDLRLKSYIVPIDPDSAEFKNPVYFYKKYDWILPGSKQILYNVQLSRVNNYVPGGIEYYQEGRYATIHQYIFKLRILEKALKDNIRALTVNIVGTELIIGNTLTEDLIGGIEVPVKKEDLTPIIEDIKLQSDPHIGDILKESKVMEENNNNYKFTTTPYRGARYYDKNFNILEIIKPSLFVESPTSSNNTETLN